MEGFRSIPELSDVVSILAYCFGDNTVLVTQNNLSGDCWIPSSKILPGGSLNKQVTQDAIDIFGNCLSCEKLMRIYKFWVPPPFQAGLTNPNTHVHHYIFEFLIDADSKKRSKGTTGKYRGKLFWLTEIEFIKLLNTNSLRSSEIHEYWLAITNKTTEVADKYKCEGTNYLGNFIEVNENVLVGGARGPFEVLVETSGLRKDVQISLYKEFLLICFPCVLMGLQGFTKFFSDLGWVKDDLPFLFRSADTENRHALSFRNLLYILASVEPDITLTGPANEIRNKYLFRFYDRDKDDALSADEFKLMITAIRKSKRQTVDAVSINKELNDTYRLINVKEGDHVPLPTFMRAIAELKLRTTAHIFHSPISVQNYLKEACDRESKAFMTNDKRFKAKNPRSSFTEAAATKVPPPALGAAKKTPFKYELACHSVKINVVTGTLNIDQLSVLDFAVSSSSTKLAAPTEIKRKISMDQFNMLSVTNEILKTLRILTNMNKRRMSVKSKSSTQFNWGTIEHNTFAKQLINISSMVEDIFKKEPRLLPVSSPVYVMGDFHGNFLDLLYFEKIFWQVGPGLCPCNMLFLGDYVDRGSYSIEVIAYLFCYKIQNPQKIRLIRGNHEIRDVQKMFTFYSECTLKFGDKLGTEVWNALNNAFDVMPLAAVIDDALFCCHGGIPPPWLCPVVTTINDIPVRLSQPDEQSALAWDLMWNDPIRSKGISDKVALELIANEGFAINSRRGTAHVFSSEALERFLKCNGFTHLIRAHEVASAGFNIQQNGKLLTVFSSSKYCGNMNDCACILVDQSRLRVLRLETD